MPSHTELEDEIEMCHSDIEDAHELLDEIARHLGMFGMKIDDFGHMVFRTNVLRRIDGLIGSQNPNADLPIPEFLKLKEKSCQGATA